METYKTCSNKNCGMNEITFRTSHDMCLLCGHDMVEIENGDKDK